MPIQTFFSRASAGASPHLVLIHGAAGDHSVWDGVMAGLPGCIALDLPGHGRTQGPVLGSVAALADWLAGALDQLGLGPIRVAGHSLGGLVALDLAARHAHRVAGVVTLGSAGAMPVHPDLLALARDDPSAAVGLIAKWGFGPQAAPDVVAGLRALMERAAPGVLHADLAACDAHGGIGAIRCPALVIAGAADKMCPVGAARDLAAAIASARLEVLDGIGHMMPVECPGRLIDLLRP